MFIYRISTYIYFLWLDGINWLLAIIYVIKCLVYKFDLITNPMGNQHNNQSNNGNYPLTKVSSKEYIKGYWHSNSAEPGKETYPNPLPTVTKVSNKFLENLKVLRMVFHIRR